MCAGVQIHQALAFLSEDDHPVLREAVHGIVKRVEGGVMLSQAMLEHPQVFPPLTCHLIRAGETSGRLPHVLPSLVVYLEQSVRLQKRMLAAFT